ncbi:MAG: hypothetical protein JXB18_02830 [Sedimentisphaerales bacterium]|nr:hypothetical protein [Sedimentisphaerales bacterium]
MDKTIPLTAISLILIVSALSQAATYGGGNGTLSEPYQIWTAGQMNSIGANPGDWTKNFKLMADIDMSVYTGTQYRIIGNAATKFTGTFNGNGYVIRNLTYTTPLAVDYVGLFGWIEDAFIQNLGIRNISMSSTGKNIGGLAGRNYRSTVTACYTTGSVTGTQYVGGLVGFNYEAALVSCYSACLTSGGSYIGGLVGRLYNGSISACYATGAATADSYVGGLIGRNYQGKVRCCYAAGKLYAAFSYGGICGDATIGGGYEDTGNIWNTETSQTAFSVMGTGKTTLQMKTVSTYIEAGWDFNPSDGDPAEWWMPNNHFPHLPWEVFYGGGSGTVANPYQIKTPEHMNTIGATPDDWASHFKLMENIDMSAYTGTQYNIIGNSTTPFTGTFDGNKHIISSLTFTTAEAVDHAGLFGWVENAVIRDLGLDNITIASGGSNIGGLVGHINNSGTIAACYMIGSVSGSNNVGGLVGLYDSGSITTGYAAGSVSGSNDVGGLVGHQTAGTITACYATALVSGTGTVGGLVGFSTGTSESCFWDIQTSGQLLSAGGSGKAADQMKTQSTYTDAGWDFTSADGDLADWWMPVNNYPRLPWELTYGGGRGTAEDPYQIWTAEQLNTIGLSSTDLAKHFKLMADIDMAAYTGSLYNIIGSSSAAFTGIFDGNGYCISSLTIDDPSRSNVGLFGATGPGSRIHNLHLANISVSGSSSVGGIVGFNHGGTITACHAEGLVTGEHNVGIVAGLNDSGHITDSSARGSAGGFGHIGGLLGINKSGWVDACYAAGSVMGANAIGGLTGANYSGTIRNCYTISSVTGSNNFIGGLTGYNNKATLADCYSTGPISQTGLQVGGLIGWNSLDSTVTACFWDTQTSGMTNSVGGGSFGGIAGKTTSEMQQSSTFMNAGWDFIHESDNGTNDLWQMRCEGSGYPRLNWQILLTADLTCPDGITLEDLMVFAARWLTSSCTPDNAYCDVADLNQSGTVDLADWDILSIQWLLESNIGQ